MKFQLADEERDQSAVLLLLMLDAPASAGPLHARHSPTEIRREPIAPDAAAREKRAID